MNYNELADYLGDHLWMTNSLDYDFLKQFTQFLYKGPAYRVIFSKDVPELKSFQYQSFAKTLEGANNFILNTSEYDKDVVEGKVAYIYYCEIEGFDINEALRYFKKHGGLSEKTINSFIDEEEIIAFTCSEPQLLSSY